MRFLGTASLILGALLLPPGAGRADDATQAIIDKAIKAHGGATKLTEKKATQTKSKGSLELGGGIEFTQEVSLHGGKLKEAMHLQVAGNQVNVTTVFDGTKGWMKVNDEATKDLDGKILDEVKEAAYVARLTRLVFLKDKSIELSPLGEVKVNDRPAVGVKVTSKGHRDLNLLFDKATGLLAKAERRVVDIMSGNEVTEERIIKEYQDVDGMKIPKAVLVNRDGKKFLELEVTEAKFPDSLDDSEFAKP
jgi:hypothetical protein